MLNRPMLRAAAAAAIALAGSGLAQAGPVTVTQTLSFDGVAAFGFFSTQDAALDGWSSLWPFTQPVQIGTVTLTFTSADTLFNNPVIGPEGSGTGTPGVEIGFLDGATRTAIASTTAAAPTISLTSNAGAIYTSLVAALLDGDTTFSVGAFVNFPDAIGGAYSNSASLNTGTLVISVDGVVSDAAIPEPASLALAGLALTAAGWARARRRHNG